MVAGRGLLPLLCLQALFYTVSALNWLSNSQKSDSQSYHVRIRRSGHHLVRKHNSSFPFGDLMYEDDASAGGGIQEKVVVRGQVVMLDCLERDKGLKFHPKIKDTHSDAAVRWFHDDKEVRPDLRVTWSVLGKLRISHAVSSDSGVWRCRKDGFFRRPLRLIVTIPPERPYLVYGGAPLAEGARLTTRAGNPLHLLCVVDGGNPSPTIAWFLNEKDVTGNSSIRNDWRQVDDQFSSVSNATIERVLKSHHNASVVCRVVHPALSRPLTTHLKLNIEYPPDFRLRRWPAWGSPLREGASVSVLCLVDSNPPSSPSWIKKSDGKEEVVITGGWLNITTVLPEHRGWYKCSTNHPFGHYSSHSFFINVMPPKTPPKGSGDSARVGASRLGGGGSSVPSSSSTSFNNRKPGSHGRGSSQAPCTSGSSSLCWNTGITLDENGTKKDSATQQYPLRQREEPMPSGHAPHCPSSEEKVHDKANDYIWRSDIKIKVMNRTHTASEGGPAMLTAHICGSRIAADQVTWIPPSKKAALTPGLASGRWTAFNLSSPDSQKCVLSNLHIVPVEEFEDSGSWVVLVVTSQTAHASIVQLNVTSAAKSLAAATLDADSHGVGTAVQLRMHFIILGLALIVCFCC